MTAKLESSRFKNDLLKSKILSLHLTDSLIETAIHNIVLKKFTKEVAIEVNRLVKVEENKSL